MARNTRELAQRPAVDPQDEPSAEWGWHGGFPKGMVIAGWVSVFILLAMIIGNHTGRVENLWLIGIALVMALGLVLHSVRKRTAWRR
ncbi:DUF2631 domain-containing protein [Pseudonocardia sp. MH-G8]|uniref:DUF2631 domain-containing protein n=1 Tax=Pseudonocardia sp. MH-G8 TaxID=1854588 RepID=UPI000BA14B5D|nr:DUF2631 domain-containing protein [Pseudonocardia sp. MH-G8]OZM78351.1 hypothetical protein CFP66_30530 [Pseudonocardia sp. MH-G8]